jgi:hypothetical protein
METVRALETEIEHSRTHAAHLLQAVLKEAFSPAKSADATPSSRFQCLEKVEQVLRARSNASGR